MTGCVARSVHDYALKLTVTVGGEVTDITTAAGSPSVTNTEHGTVIWTAPADFAPLSTNATLTLLLVRTASGEATGTNSASVALWTATDATRTIAADATLVTIGFLVIRKIVTIEV